MKTKITDEILKEIEIKHDDCGNKVFIDSSAIDQIKQSLYELIKEKMPEKKDLKREGTLSSEYVAMGEAPATGYNLAISDIHKVLSEIFE